MSDTPMTMSGLMIGMLETVWITVRFLPRKLLIPIAADVPRIVAKKEAKTAIIRVFHSEFIMCLSLKSDSYHFSVKPFHTVDMLLLNEKMMNTMIGRYRKTIISAR